MEETLTVKNIKISVDELLCSRNMSYASGFEQKIVVG